MANEPTYVIDGKLDPVFKEKWLAALRSGRYQKGISALRTQYYASEEPSFCCLGVACDLIDPEAWDTSNFGKINWGGLSSLSTTLPFTNGLPQVMASTGGDTWGIGIGIGIGSGISAGEAIARINDNNSTFEPVIKWIEENL